MEPDGRRQKLIIEQSWRSYTQKYRITHPVIRADRSCWPTVHTAHIYPLLTMTVIFTVEESLLKAAAADAALMEALNQSDVLL